ncbi:unnamed protein product, partial [Meganyctiphanes norvegica]
SDYKYGFREGSVYIQNMQTANGSVYNTAASKFSTFGNNVLMSTYRQALQEIKDERYAFIGDKVVLDYHQKKDCNLMLVKEEYFKALNSMVLPKKSPIIPAINYLFGRLQENGVLEKLRQRWWRSVPCSNQKNSAQFKSLGFTEVLFTVIIMVMGVGLSVIAFGLEILVHRHVATDINSTIQKDLQELQRYRLSRVSC